MSPVRRAAAPDPRVVARLMSLGPGPDPFPGSSPGPPPGPPPGGGWVPGGVVAALPPEELPEADEGADSPHDLPSPPVDPDAAGGLRHPGAPRHAASTTRPRRRGSREALATTTPLDDRRADVDLGPVGDVPIGDFPLAGGPAPARSGVVATSPVLERWRGGRLDPGRRGLAALAALAVLAAVLAGAVVLRSRPHAVVAPQVLASGRPVPGSAADRADAAASAGSPSAGPVVAGPTPTADVVVSVGGKVARPGLLHLPPGSRVDDAVRAAGGPLPGVDLGPLNLAQRLVDGELVLVGVPAPAAPATTSGAGAPAGPVDLNAATVADLDGLPGIGPVLAQKIVDWRTEHGRFGSVDQLREVGGIGESKYAELKDRVTV